MSTEHRMEPPRDPVLASALDNLVPVPALSAADRDRMILRIVSTAAGARRTGERAAAWVYAATWGRVVIPAAAVAMILLGTLFLSQSASTSTRLSLDYVLQARTPAGPLVMQATDEDVLLCAAAYLPGCAVAEVEPR